jgi:poly(3-hydroxyalkanoate) synthetase
VREGHKLTTSKKGGYQHNKLVKGELNYRQRRVDLSSTECTVLSIVRKKDCIYRLPQTESAMDLTLDLMISLISSWDKGFLAVDVGHVGLTTSPVAKNELWPRRVRDWL